MSSNPFRILVVDDENFSRQMVARLLSQLGSEHVQAVGSVAEARAAMAEDPSFSLIVSDHYMPNESGIQLLADLRRGKLSLRHDTCFMVATSSSSSALTSVALALDADSFMSKPFGKEGLARRLYDFLSTGERDIKPAAYYLGLDIERMLANAERADPAAPKKPAPKVPKKPLRNVKAGEVLIADLLGEDGHVLLQTGTILTRHMLHSLSDLGVAEVSSAMPG